MADTLKERGVFWWSDAVVPDGHYAPDDCVAGTLTIDDRGRIEIELDGILPTAEGPFGALARNEVAPDRAIAGLLKSDNQHVLANLISRNGGRVSGGISFERFNAQTCLVSDKRLPQKPRVRVLDVDLAGYEEWLRLGRYSAKRTRRSFSVKHSRRADLVYTDERGRLTIAVDLRFDTHGSFGARGADLRETARLSFAPRRSFDLSDAVAAFGYVGDLMILLTGSEYRLTWPRFALTKGQQCTAYFLMNEAAPKPPTFHECLSAFSELSECFGPLFFNYLDRRSALGPGVYLYLSTRRGQTLYEEHRFTSLVSGLEALHRSLFGDPEDAGFREKMARILASIESSRDRKWLEKRTRNFGAPSLEQRLEAVLAPVPAKIEADNLKEFCRLCAKIRNDLFHRGQSGALQHQHGPIHDLHLKASALSYLYHARLLIEIGTPMSIVERWLTDSFESYRIGWFFEHAGLKPATTA